MVESTVPLILTYNEAPNIRRTLERLAWAKEIVIVDSFSTDETLKIARGFPQVRVVQRQFDSFAGQCNFGLQQIKSEWVLSLDADYVLSQTLVDEIGRLDGGADIAGYQVRFRYCVHGRPLPSSLYPPRAVLYRRNKAHYHDEGHGHRVQIEGLVRMLSGCIDHDDRKPLERWFSEQIKYAGEEAKYLLETTNTQLETADRVRKKVILAPALVFFYTLLGKRLIFNGWPGWYYVFQRSLAEIILSLRLIEMKFEKQTTNNRNQESRILTSGQ